MQKVLAMLLVVCTLEQSDTNDSWFVDIGSIKENASRIILALQQLGRRNAEVKRAISVTRVAFDDGSDLDSCCELGNSNYQQRNKLVTAYRVKWSSPNSKATIMKMKPTATAAALSIFKYVLRNAGHAVGVKEYFLSVPRSLECSRSSTRLGERTKRIKRRRYILDDNVLVSEMGFDRATERFPVLCPLVNEQTEDNGMYTDADVDMEEAMDMDMDLDPGSYAKQPAPIGNHSDVEAAGEDYEQQAGNSGGSHTAVLGTPDPTGTGSDVGSDARRSTGRDGSGLSRLNHIRFLGVMFALNCYHVLQNKTMEGILEALRTFPSDSVHWILTSPPWNLLGIRTSAGHAKQPRVKYDIWTDDIPEAEYRSWQVAILNELWRIIKTGGVILYNHRDRRVDGRTSSPLIDFIQKSKCHYHQTLTLVHPSTVNSTNTWYRETHEYMYVLSKDAAVRPRIHDSADRFPYNSIWNMQSSQTIRKNIDHPCPFDMNVTMGLLRRVVRKGDIVLDPFAGSGTTLLAAERLGCNFIGFDISDKYHDIWSHIFYITS